MDWQPKSSQPVWLTIRTVKSNRQVFQFPPLPSLAIQMDRLTPCQSVKAWLLCSLTLPSTKQQRLLALQLHNLMAALNTLCLLRISTRTLCPTLMEKTCCLPTTNLLCWVKTSFLLLLMRTPLTICRNTQQTPRIIYPSATTTIRIITLLTHRATPNLFPTPPTPNSSHMLLWLIERMSKVEEEDELKRASYPEDREISCKVQISKLCLIDWE